MFKSVPFMAAKKRIRQLGRFRFVFGKSKKMSEGVAAELRTCRRPLSTLSTLPTPCPGFAPDGS
jgi:hypothetical protein